MTTINTSTTVLNDYTVEDLKTIKAAANQHAADAAQAHIDEYGEQWYCGFAWVNIWDIKGNTKLAQGNAFENFINLFKFSFDCPHKFASGGCIVK